MKPKTEKKGLSDKELAAKYDNGKAVDMVEALKKMVKGSSNTAKTKGR